MSETQAAQHACAVLHEQHVSCGVLKHQSVAPGTRHTAVHCIFINVPPTPAHHCCRLVSFPSAGSYKVRHQSRGVLFRTCTSVGR